MARPGTNTTSYSPAAVMATTATSLRSAWAAGGAALGNWTVGSMQTIGAGLSERNYWVLSAGTVEILCCMNNGTLSHTNSVYASFQSAYNQTQALYLSFAPEGGFAAAFGAAQDPLDQAFWDHITITQGKAVPSICYPMYDIVMGHTNPKYHLLCDDTTNMLMIMAGDRDGNDHYSAFVAADDMFSTSSLNALDFIRPEGFVFTYVQTSATPPLPKLQFGMWNAVDDMPVAASPDVDNEIQHPWNGVAAGAITATGKIPTSRMVAFTPDFFYAKVNSNYIRVVPANISTTYKTAIGNDVNYGWLYMYKYIGIPWEVGLTAPT